MTVRSRSQLDPKQKKCKTTQISLSIQTFLLWVQLGPGKHRHNYTSGCDGKNWVKMVQKLHCSGFVARLIDDYIDD